MRVFRAQVVPDKRVADVGQLVAPCGVGINPGVTWAPAINDNLDAGPLHPLDCHERTGFQRDGHILGHWD
jgi:hypothetical protein